MDLIKVDAGMAEELAPLLADFRVTLNAFKGYETKPDLKSAKEELLFFLKAGFPVFAAKDGEAFVGYLVCRIDAPCLWVEHIYVCPASRRKGAASMLFEKAEELARSMGEDTVFNYVHPNNEAMIGFLRAKGYTVLNLIEIRKPYPNEKLTTTIRVADNEFDY